MKRILFAWFTIFSLLFAVSATADPILYGTYGFLKISNNNATDAAIGETQMFVDLMQDPCNTNQVIFDGLVKSQHHPSTGSG